VDLRGVITPKWGYRLQIDFVDAKIMDVYAECKLNQYFNFQLGQFLVPFSLNSITSNAKLEIMDRAQAVEALVARGKDKIGDQSGRDIGLQVGGTLLKLGENPFIEYKIALFNGAGKDVSADNNEAKDIVGRLIINPLKDLSIGGSYYNGYDFIETSDTTSDFKERTRLGLEASYTFGRISAKGEYIMGNDGPVDRSGYYVQAGFYLLPKKFQVVAKYDYYDKNTSKDGDASTWYVGGLNYFFNPNVLLQLNYTFKEEESNSYNNNLAAVQLQVTF
jgi:phosphate-selective porin